MKPHTTRPIPLGLTALIAFFSALAALAVSNGHTAHAHGNEAHAVLHADKAAVTQKELAFRNGMRALWEDHVTWTRLAVISLVAGSPDTEATVARLLKNQTDIGNAIKPYYGAAAGNALTGLLRQHILIAADLIAAAKAGDQAKVAAEQARWRANADEIATSSARPTRALEASDLRAMLERASAADDAGSGRTAAGQVGGGRRRVRPHSPSRARDGGHAVQRLVDQFPGRFR